MCVCGPMKNWWDFKKKDAAPTKYVCTEIEEKVIFIDLLEPHMHKKAIGEFGDLLMWTGKKRNDVNWI